MRNGQKRFIAVVATLALGATRTHMRALQAETELLRSESVSGAAIATWSTTADPAGVAHLQVLVLWRDAPGSLFRGSFGTRSNATVRPDRPDDPQSTSQTIAVGDIVLNVALNPKAATVAVDGRAFDLRQGNVLLVDQVDESASSRRFTLLRVDPRLPDPRHVESLIRREAVLRSFIRCDARLQDEAQERIASILCERTLGVGQRH